ncbi:hypothetical protein [Edaphobacter dinghuensis]|nr:hypothetical protein [Edaphobacter dinghuensis]
MIKASIAIGLLEDEAPRGPEIKAAAALGMPKVERNTDMRCDAG